MTEIGDWMHYQREIKKLESELVQAKEENAKLKEALKVLRNAVQQIGLGESQFDNVDHMYTAREALKKSDEILEAK